MARSSTVEEVPPQHQVFINFRGVELRLGFVSHLVTALKIHNIKVYIDAYEDRDKNLEILLERIEESTMALVIFSRRYTESIWCLRELAKIMEREREGKIIAIPIFYKVDPSTVSGIKREFGDLTKCYKRKKDLKEALTSITNLMGITLDERSVESKKITEIVAEVEKVLKNIQLDGSQKASVDLSEDRDTGSYSGGEKEQIFFGIEQSLKELEEKLDQKTNKGTRIIGVVGMPGIGKSTLLKELFKKWQPKFTKRAFINQINRMELERLPTLLLVELLAIGDPHIEYVEDKYEWYKGQLLQRKVLVILDDVSKREQIDALFERQDWISEGSRFVIATNDMSLLDGLAHDTYVVRQLNHSNSLELFRHHAFDDDDQANPLKEDFMKLSTEFVHYARGHPLALVIFGKDLHGKTDLTHWKEKLMELAQNPNCNVVSVLQVSYDALSPEQKDAFLDIACFRSQDMDYVESLLASLTLYLKQQ